MTVAWSTFVRSWLVTRRAYPWSYFLSTLLAGVLTIGLGYLGLQAIGGGRVAAEFVAMAGTDDYLGYIAVGATAYMFTARGILWVAKALIMERRGGTLGALLLAPAGRLPYLVGFAAFAFLLTLAEALVLWMFATALGIRVSPAGPVEAIVAVIVLLATVFAMSVVLGVLMIRLGEAHIVQNTTFFAIAVISGFTFPRQLLPSPAQWLGDLVPVSSGMDVVRGVFATAGGLDLARAGVALGLSALYVLVALLWLPSAERAAMERSRA